MEIALKIKGKNAVLQRFIDKKGWTQSEFARELGLQASTVGRWFNMRCYPQREGLMNRVCRLVGEHQLVVFPQLLRDKEFMAIDKTATIYKEIDLTYLPNSEILMLQAASDDPESVYEQEKIPGNFSNILGTLRPREELVVRKMFGLDGDLPMTPQEIATEMDLTKQRVSQIKIVALRKLQHPVRLRKIYGELIMARQTINFECDECGKKSTRDFDYRWPLADHHFCSTKCAKAWQKSHRPRMRGQVKPGDLKKAGFSF